MHHISFISHRWGTAFIRFLMLCGFAMALASSAGTAYANERGGWREPGGYTGPGPAPVNIKQALSMPDGTWVIIKGNITKYWGDKQYTITDSTGSADAKIGSKAWMGQNVGATDTVVLQGKVKKKWSHTKIDVKRVIMQ